MKIKILSDDVINQIAAGEVVERPLSVVKELCENSLDADASEISVWIEGGGRKLIRVLDNGEGMSKEDSLIAFQRHATSKISNSEDLFSIVSFGFRGEALSSIASVSKVVIKTRINLDLINESIDKNTQSVNDTTSLGTCLRLENGKLVEDRTVACPYGTDIEIHDLYYNTPARKKFLKSEKYEEHKIREMLIGLALVNPSIRFRAYFDGKEVLNINPASTAFERGRELFKGSLVEVLNQGTNVDIVGLIGHPSLAKSNGSSFYLFINKRLVSDRAIYRAIKDGFDSTLKSNENPIGFISLTVSPSFVDVNVHPQKSEVKFSRPDLIFAHVVTSLRKSFDSFREPIEVLGSSSFKKSMPASFDSDRQSYLSCPTEQTRLSFQLKSPTFEYKGEAYSKFERPEKVDFKFSNLKFIGELFGCYLLCEQENEFVVVDMHAAHERYNFNLIRNTINRKKGSSQRLLIPQTIELSPSHVENINSHLNLLLDWGFDIEVLQNGIMLDAIPSILNDFNIEAIIRSIAEEEYDYNIPIKIIIDSLAARTACHGSVRSGQILSKEEVYTLFSSLDSTEFSTACPHGRPIVVSFTEGDVEKWFGRDR